MKKIVQLRRPPTFISKLLTIIPRALKFCQFVEYGKNMNNFIHGKYLLES